MHDCWRCEVDARMAGLRLNTEARAEVVRELASHFEDIYEEARANGADDRHAHERALASVQDWKSFVRDVQVEKETFMTMTPFRRKVILPGLVAMFFAAIPLFLTNATSLSHLGSIYRLYPMQYGLMMVFNLPWLLSLPLAGAAGAWTSRAGGGAARHRLLAALFPSLIYLSLLLSFLLVLGPLVRIVLTVMGREPLFSRGDFRIGFWVNALTSTFVPWIILPALCSLLGAVPFLWWKAPSSELPTHPVAA